ncbi:hypothetical protein C5S35_00605 [Candidatus Methanophagaceae archaeon]|nr:hypothetical protein C5S35_00605 [Methanophagales archaeon]
MDQCAVRLCGGVAFDTQKSEFFGPITSKPYPLTALFQDLTGLILFDIGKK